MLRRWPFLLALCFAGSVRAAPLRDGTYHCLIGFRTMLTYGDFRISGNAYTFTPAGRGPGGKGTYEVGRDGEIRWHGDIGAINRPPASVFRSAREGGVADSFFFRYRPRPGSDQTASCRRVP